MLVVIAGWLRPTPGAAQNLVRIERLQRLVMITHLRRLQVGASSSARHQFTRVPERYDPVALVPPDRPGVGGLARRFSLALPGPADVSISGRLGVYGASSSVRFRYRF